MQDPEELIIPDGVTQLASGAAAQMEYDESGFRLMRTKEIPGGVCVCTCIVLAWGL
jgi:hypothetical protein